MKRNRQEDIAEVHDAVIVYAEALSGMRNKLIGDGFSPEAAEMLVIEVIRAQDRKK